jgi:hypothetical protein
MLWPYPKSIVQTQAKLLTIPQTVTLAISGGTSEEAGWVVNEISTKLDLHGIAVVRVVEIPGSRPYLRLRIKPTLFRREQEYRVVTDKAGVCITAGSVVGLFHGSTSFLQLVRLCSGDFPQLPALRICDWPDLLIRGFVLDVSRNKVPTMESATALVDTLASLKYNQLQLYFENTFAYQQHPEVWKGCDPFTGAEVLELAAYCKERFVDLVPNQNSLGHMHSFLKHATYEHLAECPEGVDFGPRPSGSRSDPFSLCPIDPASIQFVRGLYRELLPHFTSPYVHIGMGQAVDIGAGRSKAIVDELGVGVVLIEYLKQMRDLGQEFGRTVMLWGDMVAKLEPPLFDQVSGDVIVCECGYEESHPFDERCARLADAGVSFLACPGTSSWCSFSGRTTNCIANIKAAAAAAKRHGALGFLLTDWGNHGHLQPLCVSYPAIVAAAGLAWTADEAQLPRLRRQDSSLGHHVGADWRGLWAEDELAELVDAHLFADHAGGSLGRVLCDLGNTYLHVGGSTDGNTNGTVLFDLLLSADRRATLLADLSIQGLRATAKHIKQQVARLDAISSAGDVLHHVNAIRMTAELNLTACLLGQQMLRHECTAVEDLPITPRTDLANRLIPLISKFESQWLVENRKGGLESSVQRIQDVVVELLQNTELEKEMRQSLVDRVSTGARQITVSEI